MIRPTTNEKLERRPADRPSRMMTGDEDANRISKITRRRELESLIEQPDRKTRVIERSLVVGLGTTSAMAVSKLVGLLHEQGTDSLVEVVVIDSDRKAQTGAERGPSFCDDEFVPIATDRISNVLNNPEAHHEIIEQVGLDDPETATFLRRLLNEGVAQAGQVRMYGNLALLVNFTAVKKALKSAIAKLNGTHSALEKQLASDNRVIVSRRLNVYVVFSSCGGSGSSMAIPVTALLRELTKSLPVEFTGIVMMPSTFDGVMDGKPDEQVRLGANTAAMLRELNAAQAGALAEGEVRVGPDRREQVSIPSGLFNQLMFVGRNLADGLDLLHKDAVVDASATYLAAVIGTEISDAVGVNDANQASLRGLAPDPLTGASRYLSSLGAQTLVLPVDRMSNHFTALQLSELIRQRVIGLQLDDETVNSWIQTWLDEPLDGEPTMIDARELPGMLLRCCLPNPSSITRPLYSLVHGNERLHWRNGVFAQHVVRAQTQFKEVQSSSFESELANSVVSLIEELRKSLRSKISEVVKAHGWDAALRFCVELVARVREINSEIISDAEADLATAKAGAGRLKEAITLLQARVRGLLTSKNRQNQIAAQYQTTVLAAVGNLSKLAAIRITGALVDELVSQQKKAENTLASAKHCLTKLQSDADDARPGKRLTASSLVELDVATPETDRRLYQQMRKDPGLLAETLRTELNCSTPTALRRLVTQPQVLESWRKRLQKTFVIQFGSISVVNVIADQLSDRGTSADITAIINQAVVGCQPMWQAESGQANVEFADSMIIGIPESTVQSKRDLVVTALLNAASHRIHANGQYNGTAAHVTSGDIHRIYIIRRVHGGCMHYLPDVVKAQADYDQWIRGGGHPVHIFGPRSVLKMPSILPLGEPDNGAVSFAIGLAMGWIANRGPNWYWNLERSGEDRKKFVCSADSHWDGIAFSGMKRTEGNCLDSMTASGQLTYAEPSDNLPNQLIGESLQDALECVAHNSEMIELIQDAFALLRERAGDVRVAADLEKYISDLKRRTRTSDAHYGIITKMVDNLTREVDRIRRHQPSRRS